MPVKQERANLNTVTLHSLQLDSVRVVQVLAEVAVESQPEAGLATNSSSDLVADRTQTQGSQSTIEDVVKSSSNVQAARLSEEAEAKGKEVQLPSIQSPASALADTLSALSLATPGVKVSKASRLQSISDQRECYSELAAEEPANAQEGDASVGLVYDKIMEEHVGPPSKPSSHAVPQADLPKQCLPKACRSNLI